MPFGLQIAPFWHGLFEQEVGARVVAIVVELDPELKVVALVVVRLLELELVVVDVLLDTLVVVVVIVVGNVGSITKYLF